MQRANHSPLRIGLTGGIGSGKSTVAQFLMQRQASIIDADAISRTLTASGGRAIATISNTFGKAFITEEGALNRDKMRELIFQQPDAKRRLEAIIHPLVAQITAEQAQVALTRGTKALVFDVPLLVESERWRAQVDRVLVIDCRIETQRARVMARSQLDAASVDRIIAAQASRLQRLKAADWVIYNENISIDELNSKVLDLPL